MTTTPLDTLTQHVSPLINYGLVVVAATGGTSGYQLTADGLLYVDGMFGDPRDCPEHPSSYDDLTAVSRGRMISLKADELGALATISLGERFTDQVVVCADKMGLGEWVNSALMKYAGSMAHGVRHGTGTEWSPTMPLAEVELKGEMKHAFEKQLSASVSESRKDLLKLVRAVSGSSVIKPSSSVKPHREKQEVETVSDEQEALHEWTCLRTLEGHTNIVRSVTFSPTEKLLASGSDDWTVRLWDPTGGKCLRTLEGHTDYVWDIAFSPDGSLLASASSDHTVRLWDPASGKCLRKLKGHPREVMSVAFSPDGGLLASASQDQTVRLWDTKSGGLLRKGKCLRTLRGHKGIVWDVTFNPDGSLLASSSTDATVRLWDPASGECLRTLKGHSSGCVRSVAFNFDGSLLASGSEDKTVRLWDPASGKCLRTLKGHTFVVESVAFSPEGNLLCSAGPGDTVRFWDPANGECLRTYKRGHSLAVMSVAFSPDGSLLASASQDKTVRLWSDF